MLADSADDFGGREDQLSATLRYRWRAKPVGRLEQSVKKGAWLVCGGAWIETQLRAKSDDRAGETRLWTRRTEIHREPGTRTLPDNRDGNLPALGRYENQGR